MLLANSNNHISEPDSSRVVSHNLFLVARGVWWEGGKRWSGGSLPITPCSCSARYARRRLGTSQYPNWILFNFLLFFSGTVYFRAEEKDGILLMSAFCVYCCASPLFLSSVLMAHLNKVLDVSEASSTNHTYLSWDLFSFCFILRWPRNKSLYFPFSFFFLIFLLGFRPLILPSFFHPVPSSHPSLWSVTRPSIHFRVHLLRIHSGIHRHRHPFSTHSSTYLASQPLISH